MEANKLGGETTKYCPGCKQNKDKSKFHKNKRSKDGFQYHCIECRKTIDSREKKKVSDKKRYYERKDEVYRRPLLQRLYGLALEDYYTMLEAQNNACAVCKEPMSLERMLAVDHCHNTGKVRGLLCSRCNMGIGLFKENIEYLKQAVEYMDKNGNP